MSDDLLANPVAVLRAREAWAKRVGCPVDEVPPEVVYIDLWRMDHPTGSDLMGCASVGVAAGIIAPEGLPWRFAEAVVYGMFATQRRPKDAP